MNNSTFIDILVDPIPNQTDNSIPIQTYDPIPITDPPILFEFITNGIFVSIVGILGLVGNIISMIILSRPQMRSSINCLLIGLSTFDSLVIVTAILIFGLPSIYAYTNLFFNYQWHVFPILAPVLYPVAMMAQTGSIYLTLTVTVERYVAVCHPLRARSICTYGRARLYVVIISVFAVIYNLPRFWEVSREVEYDPELNTSVTRIVPSDLRSDKTYIQVYINWSYLVFMYFFPFSSLAVLNAAIYNQVRKANNERQRLSRHQKKEIGLAMMLLCVVIVFFLCNVLALINNILESVASIIIDQLVKSSNFLVTVNSSVNFVIYCIFGEKFKRLFLRMFCKFYYYRRGGKESPDGTREDSLMSNGDNLRRNTFRTTLRSWNGHSVLVTNQTTRRSSTTYHRTNSNSTFVNNGARHHITNAIENKNALTRPLLEKNESILEPLQLGMDTEVKPVVRDPTNFTRL